MALRVVGLMMRQELSGLAGKSSVRMISTNGGPRCARILEHSPNAHLNKTLLERYTRLKYDPKYVQATYVWIDGTGENVRLKDRVLDFVPSKPEDLPSWQYDGSSTYQALGGNSDMKLVPRALYKDPFKAGPNDVIVLCDTYQPDGKPTASNHRAAMQDAYNRTKDLEPWFSIEQEYQVGPALGMKCADDLWISRYILWRIAEDYGVVVTFDPKPMEGNWNGAGGHCNFSTKPMRVENGIKAIEAAIEKLSKKHDKHIKAYDPRGGKDNERRLVGRLETSSIDKFSWGVADRGCSVRIPRGVADAKKGYLEDRRPSSNCDPYSVCNAILTTCLLDE